MENQEHQEFDSDAAFDEAAKFIETGEPTDEGKPSVAEETKQDTPDQREEQTAEENPQPPVEQTEDMPEWLANATDEVKEHFRKLEADRKRFEHQAKSHRGRIGALSKKYQQAMQALQKQQSSGNFDSDIENLKNDYPELAEVLGRILAGQNQRINDISEPLAQMVNAGAQDLAQQALDHSISAVTQAIPDAEQILSDPRFEQWISSKPQGIQNLFTSDDPMDAIYLLREFKKETSASQEQRVKRTQQISAMTMPNGRVAPKGGGDEVDEDALFNQIAAQIDKQRQNR